MTGLLSAVRAEADLAAARYGAPKSTHEALGVLTEEYVELIQAIHGNRMDRIRAEAVQIAAAALRLAEACEEETGFIGRSTK